MTQRFDDQAFFMALLTAGLDTNKYTIASELTEDSIDKLPLVLFDFSSTGQSQNGPGIWSGSLLLSSFGNGQAEAGDGADDLYALAHLWNLPDNGIVAGVAAVELVEDDIAFSQNPQSVMLGKNVSQYDGSLAVVIRSFN